MIRVQHCRRNADHRDCAELPPFTRADSASMMTMLIAAEESIDQRCDAREPQEEESIDELDV